MSILLYIGLGCYAAVCVAMFLLQGKILYHPSKQLEATPAEVGLDFEDVRLATQDGETLHGWFVSPPDGTDRAPVAVFCHGNAGNISHRLETLRVLHSLGLGVLLFDYRGYGRSSGVPSENGMALDAAAAFDWLAARGIDGMRIVAWGRSLGGAVAARLAVDRDPAAVVIESSFTSVPDMGQRTYPFLPVRLLARFFYATRDILPTLRVPVLIAHSPMDEVVPYAMGQHLYEIAEPPKRFLQLAGGHNDGFRVAGEAYEKGIRDFLHSIGLLP